MGFRKKTFILKLFAYVWLVLIAVYTLKRLNISFDPRFFLPLSSSYVLQNFSLSIAWYFILAMPALQLLVMIKSDKPQSHKILKIGFIALVIILISFLIAYFISLI
jgi:hypothetical protein